MSQGARERMGRMKEVIDQELKKIDTEILVEKFKPTFLGAGGEQVVFSFPDHERLVGKVHKMILARMIKTNLENGRSLDAPPEWWEDVEEFLKKERKAFKDLQVHFGKGVVLQERPYAMQVPVTKRMVEMVGYPDLAERMPEGPHNVYTLVRIQERAPAETISPDALSPTFEYQELTPEEIDREKYEEMNKVLLDGKGDYFKELPELLGGHMPEFVENIRQNDGFREVVRDFVEKTVDYTGETGEILDLAGEGNVTFFEKDGQWKYLLIDGRYPDRHTVSQMQNILGKIDEGKDLDIGEKSFLVNAINFARDVNLLAMLSGSEKRIQLTNQALAPKSNEFLKLHS